MSPHSGKTVINGATSQYDRWLPALQAGYAKVDDRSFADLLRFPAEFGRLINFFDLSNQVDGDWSDFFVSDPTMILAAIVALDLANAETAFLALERQTVRTRHFDRKFELLCQVFAAVVRRARDVNLWLESVGPSPQSPTGRLLRQQLVAAIDDGLGAQLRLLVGYAEGAGLPDTLGRPVPLDTSGFAPIWRVHDVCCDGSIYRGHSRSRKIDHALPALSAIFIAFVDAIARLQVFANAHLASSLEEAGHKPDVALY